MSVLFLKIAIFDKKYIKIIFGQKRKTHTDMQNRDLDNGCYS